MTWTGFVDDAGHFSLDQRREFRDWVKKFAGQEVVVTVKRRPKRQGSQQLRYLRGVVIPAVATACGYDDPDDWQGVYEGLMFKFCRLQDGPFGEPRRRSASKDAMSMEDLSRLIDQIITYAETSIPGCQVPRPEDCDLDQVYAPDYEREAS